jgi:hypothetical protein
MWCRSGVPAETAPGNTGVSDRCGRERLGERPAVLGSGSASANRGALECTDGEAFSTAALSGVGRTLAARKAMLSSAAIGATPCA